MIRACTPDKHRPAVEDTLAHLIRNGEILQIKKDTYLRAVKLRK